jgi:nicotinamide mononucleotide (NMN) deamidase PncC
LRQWIYGNGTQSLEEEILRLLGAAGYSLCFVESGTDGTLQSRFEAAAAIVPGIEIVYAAPQIGEPLGSSIKEYAEKEARRVGRENRTDVSLTILMEDEGNGKARRVGIAATSPTSLESREFSWSAERTEADVWVTTHALGLLWRLLTHKLSPRQA